MKDLGLECTLKNSDLTGITKDFLEIGVDSVLNDGLLKDIPIINTVQSIAKLGLNIRDRLFLKKIIHFLYNAKDISADLRKETIDKINNSKKYKTAVGEKLLFIIDRADEIEKAEYNARLFSYLLKGTIDYDDFIRASEAINKASIPDLKWFFELTHHNYYDSKETVGLFNAGILQFQMQLKQEKILDSTLVNLEFDISEIGIILLRHLGNGNKNIQKSKKINIASNPIRRMV